MTRLQARLTVAVLTICVAEMGYAEKALGYQAPSYFVRFGRSMLFVASIAAITSLGLYVIQVWVHGSAISVARKR